MSPTLEDDLRALRHDVAWPPTPDVVGTLPARLAAEQPRRARRPRLHPPLRPALAAALLVALVSAAVPPARSAVLEVLGLAGGEHARRVQALPPAPPRESPAQAPGVRTTIARARARVAFPVRVPAALGPPTTVHVWAGLPGRAVILVYGRRTALWAFQGSSARYVAKLVTPSTVVRHVRVGSGGGTWITGTPTGFIVEGRDGVPVEGSAAILDANVLVWKRGGVAYRLETRDGLQRAVTVARSVR